MKRILLSLMTIAIIAAMLAGGAVAHFSDMETSTGNTFSAASIDLTLDGQNGTAVTHFDNITDVVPGASGWADMDIVNVGTTEALAHIEVIVTVDAENTLERPEEGLNDTAPNGELDENLWFDIRADLPGGDEFELEIAQGYVANIQGIPHSIGTLGPAEGIRVGISWSIPYDVGDIIQSDSCEFDLRFSLEQIQQ
jgi:predicted ribosomally synthesized peptide with SipW-like signal peptide